MHRKLFERIEEVRLEGVSKSYNGSHAVHEVDLTVKGGELITLIGPSGSGKTTLLRAINRLVDTDAGKILINDIDVAEQDPVLLRRNIGYVIQQIGLFPHMTVAENIGLVPKLEGMSKEKIRGRVDELLDLVSLPSNFRNRYPRELSGGQQQRVGLARALAMHPPLILMDEPFGALDPILRKQLQNEFLKIKKELGRTIVFVTHDINEALKLGDRVCIMQEGKIIQLGTPNEIVKKPKNAFVRELIGDGH